MIYFIVIFAIIKNDSIFTFVQIECQIEEEVKEIRSKNKTLPY